MGLRGFQRSRGSDEAAIDSWSPLPISGRKFRVFNELRMEFRAKVILAKELGLEY